MNKKLKKKLLIFGHSGTLGSNLVFFLKKKFKISVYVNKKTIFFEKVDYFKLKKNHLSNKSILQIIKKIQPDIIINAAANIDIDFCEKYPSKTKFINTVFPDLLSRCCETRKIKLVHISTDHIYDNENKIKKSEKFKTKPINNYAKQKITAEKLVLNNNSSALIIRTNFFSHSKNKNIFLNQIFENIKRKKKIFLFTNYFFCPIYSKYLSFYIEKLLDKNAVGVFNVVSSEVYSKYDFVMKVLFMKNLKYKKIVKIKYHSNLLITKRCSNLAMDNQKLKNFLKIKVPSLNKQIKEFVSNNQYINRVIYKKFLNKKKIIKIIN